MATSNRPKILDAGMSLTLRPMRYPVFYDMFRNSIKNTWTVEEIDFSRDPEHLRNRISESELHLTKRLVAFFATGDTIVANNLVLNLYKHINSPEARLFLSRQLYEEALHIQFYLTLLDTYIPDIKEREEMFEAIENVPSVKRKAEFCFKWMSDIEELDKITTFEQRQQFLRHLFCFALCIEGLFFFGAFAYVYYLRSKGLLDGLGDGTDWVFRDETQHIKFAVEAAKTAIAEEPELITQPFIDSIHEMTREAVECEYMFAEDVLGEGIAGLPLSEMKEYLQFVADMRMREANLPEVFGNTSNPFSFMGLQDAQPMSNFFERTVTSYQTGFSASQGDVVFDEDF